MLFVINQIILVILIFRSVKKKTKALHLFLLLTERYLFLLTEIIRITEIVLQMSGKARACLGIMYDTCQGQEDYRQSRKFRHVYFISKNKTALYIFQTFSLLLLVIKLTRKIKTNKSLPQVFSSL